LHREGCRAFNAGMKTKSFLIAIVSLALSGAALADTASMMGTVVAVTPTVITVQKGTEVWDIKLGQGTSTTVTGNLTVGATVTVRYNVPDAQKKEAPTTGGTPTPASG
jgi:hypothetical protein